MKHRINPQVDCVFKALLGAENNRNLPIHFINAMLQSELPSPVASGALPTLMDSNLDITPQPPLLDGFNNLNFTFE